jgi:hypothetical protein
MVKQLEINVQCKKIVFVNLYDMLYIEYKDNT